MVSMNCVDSCRPCIAWGFLERGFQPVHCFVTVDSHSVNAVYEPLADQGSPAYSVRKYATRQTWLFSIIPSLKRSVRAAWNMLVYERTWEA